MHISRYIQVTIQPTRKYAELTTFWELTKRATEPSQSDLLRRAHQCALPRAVCCLLVFTGVPKNLSLAFDESLRLGCVKEFNLTVSPRAPGFLDTPPGALELGG